MLSRSERPHNTSRFPWGWGSKISEHLLWEGLASLRHLFTGTVLDLGCGKKPYQVLLGGVGDSVRWIGLDFANAYSGRTKADVFGSGVDLPFRASSFDTILSTQVLEHVPHPRTLLREVYRVLKLGGHLVLTAPQTNPLHEEPHDYFRYTSYGLRSLAESAGLEVLEVRALGGAIATIGQMVVWHLSWLRRIPGIGRGVHNLVNAFSASLVLKLDGFSHIYGGGAMKDTLNWLLVARKPA